MTRSWFVFFIFLARYSSPSLCFCQQFIRIVLSPRVAVAWLLASKFMVSSPCSAPSYSSATTVLQISSSCLFLPLLLNPPFSFTWHSAEDGSDASDPIIITFLLVVLLQQLFTWLLCLAVARSRSVLSSTALWLHQPGILLSLCPMAAVTLSWAPALFLPLSYTCKEVFLHQCRMSFFAYPIQIKLAVFVFTTSKNLLDFVLPSSLSLAALPAFIPAHLFLNIIFLFQCLPRLLSCLFSFIYLFCFTFFKNHICNYFFFLSYAFLALNSWCKL